VVATSRSTSRHARLPAGLGLVRPPDGAETDGRPTRVAPLPAMDAQRDSDENMMDIAFSPTSQQPDFPSASMPDGAPVDADWSPSTPSDRAGRSSSSADGGGGLGEDPLNPALFSTAKAQSLLNEAAMTGWLSKEGHVVKNWKRRYFVLWPKAGSAWAGLHTRAASTRMASPTSQQLLLYYESPEAKAPRGVIALRRGEFQTGSEHGTTYRGEDTLVLTVDTPSRKRFILRSDVPGDPTELIKWAELMKTGTLGAPELPEHDSKIVQLAEPVAFIVRCPAREKAPGVRDIVSWRRSPNMEDKVAAEEEEEQQGQEQAGDDKTNTPDAEVYKGILDGSRVQGVAENAEWLQVRTPPFVEPFLH
jgi:hypothetical protein